MIKLKQKSVSKRAISVLVALIVALCPCFASELYLDAESKSGGLIYFEDDFNRADGDIHGDNDWYSVWTGSADKPSHKLENGQLLLHDYSNGGDSFSSRPASEATVNQRVSVDITNLDKLANYATANVYLRYIRSNNYSQNSDCGYRVVVTNEYIRLSRDGNKWNKSGITTGGGNVAYTHNYGHTYRVEFTAIGTNPTNLSATLYDVTDGNTVVATVSGTDDTEYLQVAGTAALGATKNGAGQTTAIYDNFKYEQIDTLVAFDKFDRADGDIGNGWILGSKSNATISSEVLKFSTKREKGDYNEHINETALLRPMSEAKLEQVVSADFWSDSTASGRPVGEYSDQGGALIVRCQGETVTGDNCYRLVTRFGFDAASAWKTPIYLYNSKGEVIYTTFIYRASSQKYRLELSASSISETETKLGIKIYDLDKDGNITATALNASVIDDDANLQKAGTVGFSMYDRWGGTLNVDNFSYISLPEAPEEVFPEDDVIPIIYEDKFDGEDAILQGNNGWIDQQFLLNKVNVAEVKDKTLILDNGELEERGTFTHKLLRPLSEATLNQRVSVDILNLHEIDDFEIDLRISEIPSSSDAVNRQGFYSLIVGRGHMIFATKISWGQGEIAGVEFRYVEGHTYRVVASAQGSLPTVLTATLYDMTDGEKVVATLTARDQTLLTSDKRSAHIPGTVGISYRGKSSAKLDNFVYCQTDSKIFHDSFNRKNGAPENGWEISDGAKQTAITSTQLSLNNGGKDNFWNSALMRPMDEKTVEQAVIAEYSRPNAATDTAEPVVFARAQTDKKISVDSTDKFASYYATLKYTGEWSSVLSIYKVAADGTQTLLGEKSASDYGAMSTVKVRLKLLAQGTNPTKLTAMLCAVIEQRIIYISEVTVYDNEPVLQTAGTTGISYTNSTGKFALSKFSFLEPQVLPSEPVIPEDMDEDYMLFFTGTVKSGDFGQWVELDPKKTYIYSARLKKLSDSGGFGLALRYNPRAWGHMYKNFSSISSESDPDTSLTTLEFKVPEDAHILPNGKARVRITVHEGGLSSTGYATDFTVYDKEDSNKTNLLINPDFKKGFFGWAGHGYYVQGAEVGGVMKSLGSGEVELVKYDELSFVRDDSDVYFDDGNWAEKYNEESLEVVYNNIIKGYLKDTVGNPLKDVTVLLSDSDFKTKTDKNGYFSFSNIPEEMYYLSIRLDDGTECEFDELLVVMENSNLDLELTYDSGDSEITGVADSEDYDSDEDFELGENEDVPKTGERNNIEFAIITLILSLSVLSGMTFYKKTKNN